MRIVQSILGLFVLSVSFHVASQDSLMDPGSFVQFDTSNFFDIKTDCTTCVVQVVNEEEDNFLFGTSLTESFDSQPSMTFGREFRLLVGDDPALPAECQGSTVPVTLIASIVVRGQVSQQAYNLDVIPEIGGFLGLAGIPTQMTISGAFSYANVFSGGAHSSAFVDSQEFYTSAENAGIVQEDKTFEHTFLLKFDAKRGLVHRFYATATLNAQGRIPGGVVFAGAGTPFPPTTINFAQGIFEAGVRSVGPDIAAQACVARLSNAGGNPELGLAVGEVKDRLEDAISLLEANSESSDADLGSLKDSVSRVEERLEDAIELIEDQSDSKPKPKRYLPRWWRW